MNDKLKKINHQKIKNFKHNSSLNSFNMFNRNRVNSNQVISNDERLAKLSSLKKDPSHHHLPHISFSNSMVDLRIRNPLESSLSPNNDSHSKDQSISNLSQLNKCIINNKIGERKMFTPKYPKFIRDQFNNRREKKETDWLNKSTKMIQPHFSPLGISKPQLKGDESKRVELTKDQILNEIFQIRRSRTKRSRFKVLPLINRKMLLINQLNRKQMLKDDLLNPKGIHFNVERTLYIANY